MNEARIQFVDLAAQYQQLKPEIDEAVAKVSARGDFILGEDVKLFEQEFAAFCQVPHCLAVALLGLRLAASSVAARASSTVGKMPCAQRLKSAL